MANPNKGLVDNSQILRRSYDAVVEALRFIPAQGTEFAIELDAADGDNVAVPNSASFSMSSASLTNIASGNAIAPFSSAGSKSFQLYCEVLATAGASTAGAIVVKLELSPSDSGAFMQAATMTIPLGSATGFMLQSTLLSALSRRLKVSITSNALVAGDQVKFYLIGGSN